jgi:hypothetical protein
VLVDLGVFPTMCSSPSPVLVATGTVSAASTASMGVSSLDQVR